LAKPATTGRETRMIEWAFQTAVTMVVITLIIVGIVAGLL
jgi:hypothetical protein